MPKGSSPSALVLVTGTSSGIGETLARELLARGWRVVGVARRRAQIVDDRYTHVQVDVGDLASLASTLDAQVGPLVADAAVTRLGLVNNAAMEALLGTVSRLDATKLPAVYAVNVAAPVLLMGWFQRHARAGQPLRIVNVSTGAAVAAFPGLAAYGNTKAALRMAGMVFAAELDAEASSGARGPDTSVLSYEPGRVDTPMQAHARTTPVETFPLAQMFNEWHTTGLLLPPTLPATEIADYLDGDGHPRWDERRIVPPPAGDQPAIS